MGATAEELAEVDEFLAANKTLAVAIPNWREYSRPGQLEAKWNIEDPLGINQAHLRFTLWKHMREQPSVSVIFRGKCIWRLDIVEPDFCKDNHLEAMSLNLPAVVCGSHCHSWSDNRSYVARNGFSEIPVRRPVQAQLRKPSQMLPWIADEIGIQLTPEQRKFDAPTNHDLLGLL